MSFLLQENIADPSSDVPVLNITPQKPVELADLVDIVNGVRLRHSGVISFAKGSIRAGAVAEAPVTAMRIGKNPRTCGWHVHGRSHALNISRGSDIPTLFARPEDISSALLASIMAHIPELTAVSQLLHPAPLKLVDVDERTTEGPTLPFIDHMRMITDTLALDKSKSTPDKTAQAWNVIRTWFSVLDDKPNPAKQFLHQIMFNIIRESQTRIPGNKVLAMSPKNYDAYMIPARRAHARSLREGRLYRPANENNIFVALNSATGQSWMPTP